MSMELPEAIVIEGIARAFAATLTPELQARIVDRIAEMRSELMTPAQAAEMLGVTAKTLLKNHVEWGIDKCVAMGADNPRFLRTQILASARATVIAGRKPKPDGGNVTDFPTQPARRAS